MAKARKYYIVVGKHKDTGKWEIMFGDYDRNVAIDEQGAIMNSSESDDYSETMVKTCQRDDQTEINYVMDELNKGL